MVDHREADLERHWRTDWRARSKFGSNKPKTPSMAGLQSRLHRFDSGGAFGLRGRDIRLLALSEGCRG
jgi:hypothetical protein